MENKYPCVLYNTVSQTIISFGVVELTPTERIARNTKRKEQGSPLRWVILELIDDAVQVKEEKQ